MKKKQAFVCIRQTDKREQVWLSLKADIESRLGVIHAIDTGKAKGYNRSLFVESILNKVGTFAGKGDVDIVRRAVALVSEYNKNSAKPAVTERNRLFRMEVMALETRSRLEADYGNVNMEIPFNGGTVVINHEADRLQIVYGKIPDDNTRKTLKSYGFRWSPAFKAWQRMLTVKAVLAAEELLGINIGETEKQTTTRP
ncbi:putative uncharacterized protein [Prevotella sp. CAG:1124]|nr:putative uncharacterized protein [Prevotella sp. CAG:1124]